MKTFLFWNINNQPLEGTVSRLVQENNADILILAECQIPVAVMLTSLHSSTGEPFYFPSGAGRRISIYTRFSSQFLQPLHDDGRLTVRKLLVPGCDEILLGAVHFVSKLRAERDQSFEAELLARTIRDLEAERGHDRTVLVGDFNMNPFESGMVAASALHAVMDQNIARRKSRTVRGKAYPFFYNPMWSRFGDLSPGPPGTYFYGKAGHETLFWNMFDQVLLRPTVLEFLQPESVRILECFREDLDEFEAGRRAARLGSDHLPILFSLRF